MVLTLALLGSAVDVQAALPAVTVSPPVFVTEPVLEPSLGWSPALASSGAGMLVAYLADTTTPRLMGRLLESDGTPLGLPIMLAEEAQRDVSPSVVFDGVQYIVSWQLESGALYYRRFNTAGDPLGAAELVDVSVSPAYAVGVGEAGALFVTCKLEQCSTRLLAGDDLGQEQTFATLGSAGHVSLAHSDGEWLVAIGYVSGGGRLVQLSADGAELPGLRHDIDIADAYDAPLVAPVPDGFVAAWVPDGQMQLGHIDFDGGLTLAAPWTNAMQRPKALHATGAELVLYAGQREPGCNGCGFIDRLQRVDATLAPVGAALTLSGFGDLATTASSSPHFFAYDEVGHIAGARVELAANGLSLGTPQAWSVGAAEQYLARSAPTRDGWLVAWHEDPPTFEQFPRVRASFLSALGAPQGSGFAVGAESARLTDVACTWSGCIVALADDPGFQVEPLRGKFFRIGHGSAVVEQMPGEWTDNVRMAASEHSTLLATVTVQGPKRELLLRLQDDAGELIEELALRPIHAAAVVSRPLPLAVKLDGDEFVVVWYDLGVAWSVHVPVMGPIIQTEEKLLFSKAEVLQLDAAFASPNWWASSQTQAGASWYERNRQPEVSPEPISSLVSTHGVVFAAMGSSAGSSLAGNEPGGAWSELARFDDVQPHLSAPHEGKMLLASSQLDATSGAPVRRINTRVVTVDSEAGAGGAAGAGGDGGEAGDSGEAAANAGGVGAVGEGGRGPEPSGASGGDSSAPTRAPRRSKGCGCRVPAPNESSNGALSVLVLALVLARARRMTATSRDE